MMSSMFDIIDTSITIHAWSVKGADTQDSRKTGSKSSSLHFVTLSALAPQRLN